MRQPPKPFRVGFVGTGAIAGVHLDAVTRLPGAVLVGVTDRDAARARDFAARARGVRVFPDLESMVAAGVDVVHVLTPPHAHARSRWRRSSATATCWSRSRSRPATPTARDSPRRPRGAVAASA